MKILLTGVAGFIGWKTAEKLLSLGHEVVGIDNINDYYDTNLKEYRLSQLKGYKNFSFYKCDIENRDELSKIFNDKFDAVINLAARAGVRYSIENPYIYISTNVMGTLNLLELCKEKGVRKFILASTSSLYAGQSMPFREDLPVNNPISPYAASKKAAEVMCYTYHYLYGIDVVVLRYFTVYGPAGRPDMSYFRFVKFIMEDRPVEIYGDGTQSRDFTYVDDIAEGTVRALFFNGGYEVINLGGNKPHKLIEVLNIIEEFVGKKAKIKFLDFHKADMKATWADIEKAKRLLGWEPKTSLRKGLEKTVDWFLENEDFVRNLRV